MSAQREYVIVDLETTGGDPKADRITEIAIYRYNGERIVDSFESLVNPEVPIPPFITGITGITNDMVANAPRFFEIARNVVEITRDAVFVAHNVRFDYSFLQKEYRKLGYTYTRRKLCTIQLSKKFLPDMSSYGLKNLCLELNIHNESRHRATGDAKATLDLFSLLLNKARESDALHSFSDEIAVTKLPPHVAHEIIDELPEETGVYYFHDSQGNVLYVGKSTNIRSRVLQHFQSAYNQQRTIELFNQIHDVSFELTGSEIIALLKENEEIKRLQPLYNRMQLSNKHRYGLFAHTNKQGYIELEYQRLKGDKEPLALFTSKGHAEGVIQRQAKRNLLCPKYCGIENLRGGCFYKQLQQCKGACEGAETPEIYNERVYAAILAMNYGKNGTESFYIISEGRHYDERSVVWIEEGKYRGYSFVDVNYINSPAGLREYIHERPEYPDVQRIIRAYIKRHPKEVVAA